MNNIETAVAQHYGDNGLLARIYAGLNAAGVELANLQPDDLAAVDEFHIGGRKATAHAIAKMDLNTQQHVLDIGCGIGGAARYIATQTDCNVTGIDLTPEYIAAATTLTEMTGLDDKINFKVASALNMPFEANTFDAAITFHVAMNIPQRADLYCEIARVMKPGSTLCIYDVMKKNDQQLEFPVPWAESAETSHLVTLDEMSTLLQDAGFTLRETEDRTEFALNFFRDALAAVAPPPLGLHLVMGASTAQKLKNTLSNTEQGRIVPVQILATRL